MLKVIYDESLAYQATSACDCTGGDCACSLAQGHRALEQYHLHESIELQRSPEISYQPLGNDYHIAYGPYNHLALLNKDAVTLLNSFASPAGYQQTSLFAERGWARPFVRQAVKDLVRTRLLYPVTDPVKPLKESHAKLTAWLHITDRCNLRCAYCYLPHSKKDMPVEVGKKAVDILFSTAQKHKYTSIKIKYAGGEPLIKFDVVSTLHQYALHLSQVTGISVDGIVLSNGTLLKEKTISTMRELGLRLMISVDGLGQTHDIQRVYANGQGSFRDVSYAVEMGVSYGLVPDVSVTISGRNAAHLKDLMVWLLDYELPFSLNFYRENQLSQSESDLALEDDVIINGVLSAYKVIESRLPKRSFLASLVDRANLSASHLRTCGVGQDYMVFDYRGGISKCQMQIFKPVVSIDSEDPLTLLREDTEGLLNLHVDRKIECQACSWKYWCAGGCAFVTHRHTGRYDVKSPNCKIYKALFPAALGLEAKRLLKYENSA
jgi:uncharacterized protein